MVTAKPRLHAGVRMSLEEFRALGETDERLELFDGVLHVMSSPTKDHQFLTHRMARHLDDYIDAFTTAPAEIHLDITTILSPDLQRAVQPDIVVILAGRDDINGGGHVEGVPDIVVEILSSDRSHDLVFKRRIYAEAGVREYWICDPRNDTILLLELRDGWYVERAALSAGDALGTPLLPGLSIPLANVFRHPRRPRPDE